MNFSLEAVPEMNSRLTHAQKSVFDAIWNHFLLSGNSMPVRSLAPVIGKQPLQDVLKGLNGGLMFELMEEGNRCLKLTIHGAFFTGHGVVLGNLFVQLVELVKKRYEADHLIKSLSRNEIKGWLNFNEIEITYLFNLLKLGLPPSMPIKLTSWASGGIDWNISITDEVVALFQSDNTISYLSSCLSATYQSDLSWSLERSRMQGAENAPSRNTVTDRPTSPMPYVGKTRLDELRLIKSKNFDCTRLVSMCEELNDCSSRQNAHAVIMLTRAILDHVTPIFGFQSFKEVASNYGSNGTSFKKSAERLENHSRKVADRLLHMPMRDKEVVPQMQEVWFSSELEGILAELCRVLKCPPA